MPMPSDEEGHVQAVHQRQFPYALNHRIRMGAVAGMINHEGQRVHQSQRKQDHEVVRQESQAHGGSNHASDGEYKLQGGLAHQNPSGNDEESLGYQHPGHKEAGGSPAHLVILYDKG